MATASSSASSPLGPSLCPTKRTSDTQRILTSIALSRPVPYGQIPLQKASTTNTASAGSTPDLDSSDVNLSGIEGFDYDESWSESSHSFSPGIPGPRDKGKERALDRALSSLSSTNEAENGVREKRHSVGGGRGRGTTRRADLSRTSTISSERSSVKRRRPRLMQQSISPPVASSQLVSVIGKPSISARGSQSLADKGEGSALPSLYDVSRGRSAHVSPSRRWRDRRGASASVLSGASGSGSGEDKVEATRPGPGLGPMASGRIVQDARKNSVSSLETPLFSSEDGLSSSEGEDDAAPPSSRRSSMERDRRRGLKVLLAPSAGREEACDGQRCCSHSLTASASDGTRSLDEKTSSMSSSTSSRTDTADCDCAASHRPVLASDLADDESDGTVHTSALLVRRQSRSGRTLLSSKLRSSPSSLQQTTSPSRLDVIQAGLTPDGKSDPILAASPIKHATPVDVDADPLLSSTVGSVDDMIDVDAVEWNDQQKQLTPSQSTYDLASSRKQSVAEQEKERRVGFAAAYQQRLASLLWSSEPAKKNGSGEEKTSAEGTESLLTSSWRHLTTLPNFLLMPTLGPSKARANQNEEAEQEAKREEALSAAQEAAAALPSTASSPVMASADSSLSSSSDPCYGGLELVLEPKGRGVMNPLEGDADVSAYVPGLGLPIDPDLELSSVVHLQTFRTTQSSPVRSRRGSLERPALGEGNLHRRSYSDNTLEPPSVGFAREKGRPGALSKNPFTRASTTPSVAVPTSHNVLEEEGEESEGEEFPRDCSRPAVQAPVPGDYSAYNSSASEEDEDAARKRAVSGKRHTSKERGRGRSSRGRRRSSSPPPQRQQCAIGLFDGKARRRTVRCESGILDGASQMLRVRSTPNLTSLSNKQRSNQGKTGNGRGRAGSVKVVSASYATSEGSNEDGEGMFIGPAPLASSALPLHQLPPSPPTPSSLPLGIPAYPLGRPSMVSNGAHLLMLSLELEMMRNRKITSSLKPRWLKARIRPEGSAARLIATGFDVDGTTSPPSLPREGSSLRFEVVPK